MSADPASDFERGHLFHFWRGRVALYAILEALGLGPGDAVAMPGFTCVAVANAVIYTGAQPVYIDIDPDTYNVTRATIEARMSPAIKAIIVQSSFGLSADLDPILELAAEAGIPVIEDCAHGLGGRYKGRANGTVADAAFFSTQWSKPVSTGLGGIAFARDDELARRLERVAARMPAPPLSDRLMLRAQLLVRPLADHPWLYYSLVDGYRLLTQKLGLPGSSSSTELCGTDKPARFEQRMSGLQRRRWERGLRALRDRVARQQEIAARYDQFFASTDITSPVRPQYAEHSMLRYTVRVADKSGLLRLARAARLPLGDWFVSPLHPVEGDLRPWGYEPGACPAAESACGETVNLLTDRPLDQEDLASLFAH
ncbi:MAG: DegT/DnrJ/EryC1/StrS family aminotransferase [Acidobacteriota bacterium]